MTFQELQLWQQIIFVAVTAVSIFLGSLSASSTEQTNGMALVGGAVGGIVGMMFGLWLVLSPISFGMVVAFFLLVWLGKAIAQRMDK